MSLTHLLRPNTLLFAGIAGLAGINATPCHSHFLITSAWAEDILGQEVSKNLQQAQTNLSTHNFSKAMAAVDAADAITQKSDYERYVITQMRAAVAASSGDSQAAIKAYDKLVQNPRTPKASKGQMLMAKASMAYGAKDYTTAGQAAEQYLNLLGANAQMQTLLIQCHYLQQDWEGTVKEAHNVISDNEKSGIRPQENQLQMLATAYEKLHNIAGQTNTYVKLVKYFPHPQYWQILIHNLVADNSLSPHLVFNVERLRLAAGLLTNPSDFQDMGERAVQMGLPQLALNLLDEGYNRHILGTGPNTDAEAHFRVFVAQQAARTKAELPAAVQAADKDNSAGPSLVAGYNLLLNGQVNQGLTLMQRGLTKNPHLPEIAQLEYSMALMDANRTTDAVKSFNNINSDDIVQSLAQLWALRLTQQEQVKRENKQ